MIPDSVTSIGDRAFWYCSSLTSVTIGDSVTSIGSYAFYYCDSLTKVNYTGTIDDWASKITFGDYCANPLHFAKKLYINDVEVTSAVLTSATKVNSYAFYGCSSLTSVTIGNGVTSIGDGAFSYCSSLTSVTFEDADGWYVTQLELSTSGTDVTLTDTAVNATYLTDTYFYCYWYKKPAA